MVRRIILLIAVASFAGAGCKKGASAAADGVDDQARYADVDCDRMIDHMVEVLLREGTQGQPAAQVRAATQKMQEQRPTMIAACTKEKPVKKLTREQYDCLMKASSTAEMSGCP
jgi:hypothetical protein